MGRKLFISQPMNGIDEVNVLQTRDHIFNCMKLVEPDLELLDTYNRENIPNNAGRRWYLGRSIQDLDKADFVIFAPGWHKAKGCLVEHLVCELYGIPYVEWDKTTEGVVKYYGFK